MAELVTIPDKRRDDIVAMIDKVRVRAKAGELRTLAMFGECSGGDFWKATSEYDDGVRLGGLIVANGNQLLAECMDGYEPGV